MGTTQSRIISRLRIKCFSLESWVHLNRKKGKHFEAWVNLIWFSGKPLESWVNLNQYPRIRLSRELNRLKFPRYCLSHDLIRINLSGRHLSQKPKNVISSQHFSRRPQNCSFWILSGLYLSRRTSTFRCDGINWFGMRLIQIWMGECDLAVFCFGVYLSW